MHGYKWPINCTRTRTEALAYLRELLAKQQAADKTNSSNSAAVGDNMDVSHLRIMTHGEQWEERQQEFIQLLAAETAKGPTARDNERVAQLLLGKCHNELNAGNYSDLLVDCEQLLALDSTYLAPEAHVWVLAVALSTGACTINRPCAQQYVGKSQLCMVISGRLIVHAPVGLDKLLRALSCDCGTLEDCSSFCIQPAPYALIGAVAVRIFCTTMRAELIGHFKPCMTDIYLHIDVRMAD